jgi:hypothetical protein
MVRGVVWLCADEARYVSCSSIRGGVGTVRMKQRDDGCLIVGQRLYGI